MAVKKRILLHFPGFEPLDAVQHRNRYARVAEQAGRVWSCRYAVSPPGEGEAENRFSVTGEGPNWATQTDVTVFDHHQRIVELRAKPLFIQLTAGFRAGWQVMVEGGLIGYFRSAWRFGLFYAFPFAYLKIALLAALAIMLLPLLADFGSLAFFLTVPAGLAFLYGAYRFSERYYVMHLLADWRLAVALAHMPPAEQAFIETLADRFEAAVAPDADEILVTAHSVGGSVAVHVLGRVLERNPAIFANRKVGFVTLGGAILQCTLLRPAVLLRRRLEAIARHPSIAFLEVQSLNDVVNFYRARTVALSGFPDAPQASILNIRLKHLISRERRKRIGLDAMRIHRQYVLAPDIRGGFDFTFMTAGPLSIGDYLQSLHRKKPLPVREDGSLADGAAH